MLISIAIPQCHSAELHAHGDAGADVAAGADLVVVDRLDHQPAVTVAWTYCG